MEEQSPVSDCFNLRCDLPRITAPTFLFERRPFFFNKMRPFLDERPHVGSSSEVLSPPSTVELKKCRQTQLKESESSAGEVLVIVTLFSWFLL